MVQDQIIRQQENKIRQLEREMLVLALVMDNFKISFIAETLKVSPSRINQIKKVAIKRVGKLLDEQLRKQ